MDQRLLVGFASLFWGQTNAYFDLGKMSTIWQPLTTDVFLAHLQGKIELGVYCTNDENLSYWGCIDFDAPQKTKQQDSRAYQAALQVRSQYAEHGITSWIERSKSKGYHVWIFPDRPMSSRQLRQCELSILSELGMSGIEVNPKQENIWNTQVPKTAPNNRRFGIGNLVRIPYSPLANSGRMCILDRAGPMGLPRWLPEALSTRPAPLDLAKLCGQETAVQRAYDGPTGQGRTAGAHQEAWEVWQGDRPILKGERDNQFYTLVRLMKANDVIYSECRQNIIDIYNKKVLDSTGFSIDDALDKVRREYKR